MQLRKISYTYIHPVGTPEGVFEFPRSGDLMDLLYDADPYNFLPPGMPPLRVLNSFLAEGRRHRGMGGGAEWTPFGVSEEEYQNLLEYLGTQEARQRYPYEGEVTILDVPETVTTVRDLSDWKIEKALKDPNHHLSGPEKISTLPDGRKVTFREYWDWEKAQRSQRSE